jgi:hypothetical protein
MASEDNAATGNDGDGMAALVGSTNDLADDTPRSRIDQILQWVPNVTSDIGACIAAGGTLHLVNQSRKRRKMEEERLMLARQTHRLLHYVCGDAARQLGHVVQIAQHPGSQPPTGGEGQPWPGTNAT